MGGGTLQLVAYGGQDIHIIGNPEMSFFKSVYRRHTNFAMECIKQPMLGPIRSEAFKASFKLGRDGDLINKMHLQIKLPEQKNLLLTKGQGIYERNNLRRCIATIMGSLKTGKRIILFKYKMSRKITKLHLIAAARSSYRLRPQVLQMPVSKLRRSLE